MATLTELVLTLCTGSKVGSKFFRGSITYILIIIIIIIIIIHIYFHMILPYSNQITVVAFQPVQLAQASFLQKKSNIAKCFFDICNAEMAQSLSSLQKSEFLKLSILIFHVKKLNN